MPSPSPFVVANDDPREKNCLWLDEEGEKFRLKFKVKNLCLASYDRIKLQELNVKNEKGF